MSAEPVAYHTKKTFGYLVRFQCVVCLLLCALNVGLLIPLLVYTSSDVTFESSLLPPLLEVLSALVDIAVYTVAFSSAVFAFRLYPAKKAIWLPLTFFLTALVRRAASLGVEVLTSGSIRLLSRRGNSAGRCRFADRFLRVPQNAQKGSLPAVPAVPRPQGKVSPLPSVFRPDRSGPACGAGSRHPACGGQDRQPDPLRYHVHRGVRISERRWRDPA